METFSYYFDEKVTMWNRSHFTVDAENKEEADQMAKDYILEKDIDWEIDITFSEYLYDTSSNLPVEVNGGSPTLELFTDEGELLYVNS